MLVWMFVDGMGVGGPAWEADPTPFLSWLGGVPFGSVAAHHVRGHRAYLCLDASLGVEGLPGSATGQATLVTGANASQAMGRHVQAYPGPSLRTWMDHQGTLFSQLAAAGLRLFQANAYRTEQGPPPGRESAFRYAARRAGILAHGPEALFRGWAVPSDLGLDYSRLRDDMVQRGRAMVERARGQDVLLIEVDAPDRAGHRRGEVAERRWAVRQALTRVDRLAWGIYGALGPHDALVVVSDHGNAEEPEHHRHTRRPVPLLATGWAAQDLPWGGDLTSFAPWLLDRLQRYG
jgi:2,3-bisphosphoglycerate-independent phosphoglycerate mutase